jgi:type I restriction enzyme S subunit
MNAMLAERDDTADGLWPLPEGWAWAKLGEIVTVRGEKLQPDPLSTLAFIGMDDVPPDSLKVATEGAFREMKSAANAIEPGDILYGRLRPYLNKVALAQARAAASAEFIVLKAKNGIDARLVQFAMHGRRFVNFAIQDTSGDRPRIDFAKISDFELPVPPSNEQGRIVARIDELFDEITEGVAALERARSSLGTWRRTLLKSAVTGELTRDWREANRPIESGANLLANIRTKREVSGRRFGRGRRTENAAPPDVATLPALPETWVWASIGQMFEVYTGSTPSRSVPAFWGGDIPWVSSGEVAFCRIKKTREYVTAAGLGNSSDRIHPPGTVLLAMIGEGKTRGQCAILDIAACNNQNAAAIRVSKTPIDPMFIYLILQERYFRSRKESQGGNQPALNAQKVSSIVVPLPPLEEIAEIVRRVNDMLAESEVAEHFHAEIDLLKMQLRQSVLKAAFEGSLVRQDANDAPAGELLARLRAEAPTPHRARRRKTAS